MKKFLFCFLASFFVSSSTVYCDNTFTFVFLHGVFEDSSTLADLTDFVKLKNHSYINLTLPGHGLDSQNSYELQFYKWFEDVELQLNYARSLNKKIIFVGHSLGALLAINSVLQNSKNIAGAVLIEPALKPKPYLIDLSCMGKNILKDARFFLPLARVFLDMPLKDRPIAVNLACEVGKVPQYLVDRELVKDVTHLAYKIKIPFFIINNLRDLAVDVDINMEFYQALLNQKSKYYEYNDKDLPHGAIFTRRKQLLRTLMEDFLLSSLN